MIKMFLKNYSRRKSSSQKVYNFFFSTDFLKKDLHEIFTDKKIGLILAIQNIFLVHVPSL